jgi:hypothetical protein
MRFIFILSLAAGLFAGCGAGKTSVLDSPDFAECRAAFSILETERASDRINVFPVINDVKRACNDVLQDDAIFAEFAKEQYLATFDDPSRVLIGKARVIVTDESHYLSRSYGGDVIFKNGDGSTGAKRLFFSNIRTSDFKWSTSTFDE